MKILDRIVRHARITAKNYQRAPSPSFLDLFVTSVCNMRCDHCFYWRELNRKDDLTIEELVALSRSLGRIENLNLSGGEPFLRKEVAQICRQFIRHNKVRQIYVPTNGYFTERTVEQVTDVLGEQELGLFVVELSLDGMADYHDQLRATPGAFERALGTYEALVKLQERDPRLRLHAASTATSANLDEIRRLTAFLYDRCPKMDHHNLAIIRGDRRNPSLLTPDLAEYEALYKYIQRLWSPRETGRYGSVVEPMLQWAKARTVQEKRQVIPCRAGRLSAVVYANGDVSFCELHEPLGNLRQATFRELWDSEEAQSLRKSIRQGVCHCTHEVFLWPSIVFQPLQLARAMFGARAWKKAEATRPGKEV